MSSMAANVDPVTARWSNALFNLAQRAGALGQVQADLEKLGAELESPVVAGYVLGSSAGSAERLGKLDPLLGDFHELSRHFVKLLFRRRREAVLEHAAAAFRQRALEERGAVEGGVESARPLEVSEVEALCQSLARRLGKDVQLSTRINAELVGGIRVFVGSSMIDQSVQGRLEGITQRMLDARLPVQA